MADVLKQETSKSNIHRNIKNACQVLFNKTILIKKDRDFKLRHVFRDITCSNGQLMIVYESSMEPFFEFQGGFYTQYDKKMTLSLTRKGAFNLYLELKYYM